MVADERLTARFGWFEFQVALRDIAGWRIEGPWRWITAIGVRRSIRHGDLTFAGSPRGGVRLDFRSPVTWNVLRVPAFYVGVEDLEGFAATLAALGILARTHERSRHPVGLAMGGLGLRCRQPAPGSRQPTPCRR